MKSRFFALIIIFVLTAIKLSAANKLEFSTSTFTPIEIATDKATGLNGVYVVYTTGGLSISYQSSVAASAVVCQKFDLRGAAYATNISESDIQRQGNTVTITNLEGDCGYAFTDGGKTYYFWIADYSQHPYTVNAINFDNEQDCDRALLSFSGEAEAIHYYSITGRQYTIDREIQLSYYTLTTDTNQESYQSTLSTISYPYLSTIISATAPLCDTYFTLSGDRFLRIWSDEVKVQSPMYVSRSVAATTSAAASHATADNEIPSSDTNLGGSAPCEITFKAEVTDAAVFTQWQMSSDPDFYEMLYRTNDLKFTYTFTEMGTIYVRFMAADASGACEWYSETYTVSIGESALRCPNAFSPGASEGVNDLWKVSYKSIIKFDCYIFNRWGDKLFEFHDPSIGWDGKYKGKLVPAGVYYYVINAKGSDGKNYKLSGDINILNYK